MANDRAVLIVDDDAELCDLLAECLAAAGFVPTTVGSVAAALAKIMAADMRFDAVILDIGLPDGDGCHLCAQLRQHGVTLPILMLTGANAEQDVVRGLEAGANDYVRKPFRAAELVARLHAQLRLFDNTEHATFMIGPYVFRPADKLLEDHAGKRCVRLTGKEVNVLKFLYRAGGRQVGRPELLREIWGYNAMVSTHTLETHIYRLRQKIELDPGTPGFLLTGGSGYSLNAAGPATAVVPARIGTQYRAAA